MDGIFSQFRGGLFLALGCLILSGTGCMSVPLAGNRSLLDGEKLAEAAAKGETYQLVIQPHTGQPKVIEKPLSGTKHLQEILTENKAFRQFGRTEFELQRRLANGGYHRMKVEHSINTRRVDPEYDYVLHPGDRVIVKEDPSSVIDDLFDTAFAPLGMNKQKDQHLRDDTHRKYKFVN